MAIKLLIYMNKDIYYWDFLKESCFLHFTVRVTFWMKVGENIHSARNISGAVISNVFGFPDRERCFAEQSDIKLNYG